MDDARTLLDALGAAASSGRGQVYVEGGGELCWSYARLAEEAERFARRLAGLGVGAGERVVLVAGAPREFVRAFFGIQLTGAIPVPVAPPAAFSRPEAHRATARAVLESSGATTLVCAAEHAEAHRSVAAVRVLAFEAVDDAAEEGSSALHAVAADDVAFLQFTSGSTSAPRGVVVTHRALLANARAIGRHGLGFEPERDVGVSWLPLHHDMGLIGFVVTPLVFGVQTVLLPAASFVRRPALWLDAIHAHRGTISFAPNFAFSLTLRRCDGIDAARWDLSCLRILGCGAEAIDAALLERFATRFEASSKLPETAILPCYGLAESTLAVTFSAHGQRFRVDETSPRRLVSCGRPFPDHELRIVRKDGCLAADREEGAIVVRGPSVAPGYFADDEATRETFCDGWLRTGDLGYLANGELYVSGRLKDLVICHGKNCHPSDLEKVALETPGARANGVAAFGVPADGTEHVVVIVEATASQRSELARAVRARLEASFDVPIAEVVGVPLGAVPKTSSGKPQRARARAWYLSGGVEAQTGG